MFEVRPVESNQNGPHPHLERVVQKHLEHPYLRPISALQQEVEKQMSALITHPGDWLLDGGCGLGESSRHLAQYHPETPILAVDKSFKRLDRGNRDSETLSEMLWRQGQIYYLRADLVDVWQIAQRRGWVFQHAYLFYPNPWPKSEHLKRRWHGHAIFKALLDTCRGLDLRSNWQIYCEEFAQALKWAGWQVSTQKLKIDVPLSAFERKYHLAGQNLYGLQATAGSANLSK